MRHTFQEERPIDDNLVAECAKADDWIRKAKSISRADGRTVRAYLRAKQNYLDKVDAILDLMAERGEERTAE
jgi:hypothetical protein